MSSIRSIFTAPSAEGEARRNSSGPAAEDGPAPGRPAPWAGAGHPYLTRDDLMDAANAASHMAAARPAFQEHWRELQRRLEDAAVASQ